MKACAFVLMIQALKIPGEVIQAGLLALGDAIKSCLEMSAESSVTSTE